MTGTTLITGADGYLGGKIAQALLAGSDDRLLLGVKADAGSAEFASRRDRLERDLGPAGTKRTVIVPADLSRDGALDGTDPRRVTRVVHSAAITRFSVGRDEARAANIEGTARVADFAARCDNLERLAVISTLYTAGRRQGDVFEKRHDEAGFVNYYEWSKWAAEDYVWERHGGLPCSVLRLPTIIADDDSGQVSQHNAFHNTFKLYYYGLLSVVPGDRETPINLASADFAVSAIMHLLDPAVPDGTYHTCPGPEAVASLGTLTDTMFDLFERDENYRKRRLMRPVYCDEESFYDLVEASAAMKGGPIHQAMVSVAPFARQLFRPKVFRNDALRAQWAGYRVPDPADLITATASWLVATRWGRNAREES
jgi:nucleoside-diphosphate-sugar epimerase